MITPAEDDPATRRPKRRGLHPIVLATAVILLLGCWALETRVVWEMTWLTWERGPQMIGFSLAHGPAAFLLLFPLALFLWTIGVGVTLTVWWIKRHTVVNSAWQSLVLAIATLALLAVPQSFLNWIFVNRLAQSSHAADLLVQSAATGNARTVMALLAHGLSVDSKNYDGDTALYVAAATCQPALLTSLIGSGANLNATNLDGDSPLQAALANHCETTAAILQRRGALDVKGTPEQREQASRDRVNRDIQKMYRR